MPRLEVRLDEEQRRRLEVLVQERGVPASEIVRGLIDNAYDDIVLERRRLAASRLIAMKVEDPPDNVALSRELEEAHDPGGLR